MAKFYSARGRKIPRFRGLICHRRIHLDLVSPIAGVGSQGTVAAGGIVSGADLESDEALRERWLDRVRRPPHGGADFDYVKWAREVPGVTRAWVLANGMGLGTVVVWFVMDDKPDTIIPDAGEVAIVADYIARHVDPETGLEVGSPVTADVYVVAPTPIVLDPEISVTPDTAAIRAAVTGNLLDFIQREAVPGGTIEISRFEEAISTSEGEFDHETTTPAADITHASGEIAVLGTVTWL